MKKWYIQNFRPLEAILCKKIGILGGKHAKTILYKHFYIKLEVNHVNLLFLSFHKSLGSKDLWKKEREGRKGPFAVVPKMLVSMDK